MAALILRSKGRLAADGDLADLSRLESWVRERIPAPDGSLNPLDLTGFVMRDRDLLLDMFTGYAGAATCPIRNSDCGASGFAMT